MDRLRKALKENSLDWKIDNGVYDAGHDSTGNYEYLIEADITPIIALNPRSGTHHPLATLRKWMRMVFHYVLLACLMESVKCFV